MEVELGGFLAEMAEDHVFREPQSAPLDTDQLNVHRDLGFNQFAQPFKPCFTERQGLLCLPVQSLSCTFRHIVTHCLKRRSPELGDLLSQAYSGAIIGFNHAIARLQAPLQFS